MNDEIKKVHKKNKEIAKNWWNSNTKRAKVYFIVALIITITVLIFFALLLSTKEIGLTSISNPLFGEGVSGWTWLGYRIGNVGLKILASLAIICVAFIVLFIINTIIGVITWRGKRSRTVGSLIKSLLKYVVVIIAAGFVLSSWGVDIASIVAGLGVVTLIIGLGCQSLIADIVSGLFLVFEDFFDVGDIVVIDSFRGTISEIGLRSTKLIDWAGNIKAINNSQITTVTNLSRLATTLFITFHVDGGEDILRVEAVISDNIDKIGKSLPKVIGKILYKGITGLDENGIKLAFLADCQEDDRYQVYRDVTRELYLLMINNGIKVPFNKLYVHQVTDTETIKASELDKQKAFEINEVNRVLPKKDE